MYEADVQPAEFPLETNATKAIAAASRVAKMLDVYQTELCRNVTKTMITLLSNPAMEKEKSTIITNLYYLYDRLSVEHVADAYENYIKPAVLQNDKPDWFTKLAHTNEDTWSKIKTIIQGTGKPVVSVKKSKQTRKNNFFEKTLAKGVLIYYILVQWIKSLTQQKGTL